MGIHKLAVHAPTRFQNDNLMRAKAEHIKATVQHDGEVWAKTPDAAAFIKRVKGVIASPPGQAHIASGKALKGSFKNLVEHGKKIKTPATKGFHLNNADIADLTNPAMTKLGKNLKGNLEREFHMSHAEEQ